MTAAPWSLKLYPGNILHYDAQLDEHEGEGVGLYEVPH